MVLKHQAMIVQPDLFVKLCSVECLDLVEGNYCFGFVLSKDNVGFLLFLIEQNISIRAGGHAIPTLGLNITTKAFLIHISRIEHSRLGIIQLNPLLTIPNNNPIMPNLRPP